MINRRALIASAALGGAGLFAPAVSAETKRALPTFLADVERRSFAYFWETANRSNGLVPARWPTAAPAGIAATGWALTAYPIGATRGWIRREEARDRTLATLRFLDGAPTGDDREGTAGHRGFFYRALDMETGLRAPDAELSSLDTAVLHLGLLFAAGWYDRDEPGEAEIRRLAMTIVDRADWPWFQRGQPQVAKGWDPVKGFTEDSWSGYGEAMMIYVLGLGATRRPLPGGAWSAWTETYPRFWIGEGTARHLGYGPMIGHQLSHAWIDFRGIQDVVMRGAGFDYHQNSRRATMAQRTYGTANPMGWAGYGKNAWGLSLCDGPGPLKLTVKGEERLLLGRAARGAEGQPDGQDDGTIAPAAALGSIAFAPELTVPVARGLRRVPRLYGRYGFVDGFNASVRDAGARVATGTMDKRGGWVAGDHVALSQGLALAGIVNARDELVWRTMRASPTIRRGLERAGFTGGWLAG